MYVSKIDYSNTWATNECLFHYLLSFLFPFPLFFHLITFLKKSGVCALQNRAVSRFKDQLGCSYPLITDPMGLDSFGWQKLKTADLF